MNADEARRLLGVAQCTPTQLRAAYRAALLAHHPDRRVHSTESAQSIDAVRTAYRVLAAEHRARICTHSIHEAAEWSEFSAEGEVLRRECRCGGVYEVARIEAETGGVCVECSACSLWVAVDGPYTA